MKVLVFCGRKWFWEDAVVTVIMCAAIAMLSFGLAVGME